VGVDTDDRARVDHHRLHCPIHVLDALHRERSRPRRHGQALFRRRSGISACSGGLLLLAYAVYRMDLVFIVGQAAGLVIYARNIYFIWLGKRAPSPANVA
jgi:lipid A biosynthesis-like protein